MIKNTKLLLCLIIIKIRSSLINECPILAEELTFAHRAGDTTKYQENTIEIALDAAHHGYNIEFDLNQLASGEVVVFHDTNFLDNTGIDLDVNIATYDQIKNIKYLKKISQYNYQTQPKIPLFREYVNSVCSINNKISLWLDVKSVVNEEFAKVIFESLEASPCLCDDEQYIIFEVYNQFSAISYMREINKRYRCKLNYSFATFSTEKDTSFTSWKKKLELFSRYADILDFSSDLLIKYPSLIDIATKYNMCVAVYGKGSLELVDKYPKLDIQIIDISQLNGKTFSPIISELDINSNNNFLKSNSLTISYLVFIVTILSILL